MLTFKRKKHINKYILLSIIMLFIIFAFIYISAISEIPNKLLIINGKEYVFDFKMPFGINIVPDKKVDSKLNKNKVNSGITDSKITDKLVFVTKDNKDSKINISLKMFGFFPLKSMLINVVPDKMFIPCGNSIGVKIHTNGALVVGTTKILGDDGKYYEPYNSSNICIGDYIVKINNTNINEISQVSSIIEKTLGQTLNLTINRNDTLINTKITPRKASDGKYRIGIWLRDSTAGIGTLTFYDKENKTFGALGHGITDVDSGRLMTINKGEIIPSNIVAVKKGYRGNPGELKGILMESKGRGRIIKNTEYGIYGQIDNNSRIIPENKALPIALRNDIKEGPAQIITSINGSTLNAYNIEIQRVFRQNIDSSKNMIIKITDERLLNYTGGIVQGMSGSPIIQNGKLVGAVTHVLINDPTKGYAIFIESMIQKADNIFNNKAEMPSAS